MHVRACTNSRLDSFSLHDSPAMIHNARETPDESEAISGAVVIVAACPSFYMHTHTHRTHHPDPLGPSIGPPHENQNPTRGYVEDTAAFLVCFCCFLAKSVFDIPMSLRVPPTKSNTATPPGDVRCSLARHLRPGQPPWRDRPLQSSRLGGAMAKSSVYISIICIHILLYTCVGPHSAQRL